MAITFTCSCGKSIRARDEFAGKRAKCPQCGVVVTISPLDVDPDLGDGSPYGLAEPPSASVGPPPGWDLEPTEPSSVDQAVGRREGNAPGTPDWEWEDPKSSIREYAYVLLIFAPLPLGFSLLGKTEPMSIEDRVQATLDAATPEQMARALPVLNKNQIEKDELLAVMPEGRLAGAHLAHDSKMHWVYAGIAAAGFLLLTLAFFSVERANPFHLLGIGAFTGTVGIVFLFAVQFCSQIRVGIRGRGWFVIILLILQFIGWSYRSALDPDSNFLLSAFGFTFGVGLCEELCKAIPLFFYFHGDTAMGWRGACLWGLASGIGFGVSEGVMYASDSYNGVSGADIYLVRFVSCVALHAMWAASVGISIARRLDAYHRVEDAGAFGLFMLRVLAVPMVLHGLYDTLLKQDLNGWALVVALGSFGWLAAQIELARGDRTETIIGHPSRLS